MLEVLRRLIQDVNAADSLEDALGLIVAQVRAAMHTDVCTVYLHDKATQKLVFRATEGLNSEKVGQFGLGFDEGLVGWVATREEKKLDGGCVGERRFSHRPPPAMRKNELNER